MQTIGEKIEETRKRKGISLSEAAEATKIRKDFLINIETDKHNYDLPDIYKRGFIKNYAKFLKLNADKVLAQYQELLISQSSGTKKTSVEFLNSKNNLNTDTEDLSNEPLFEKASLGKIDLNKSTDSLGEEHAPENIESDKGLYIKTASIGVATLIFIILIFWLINSISNSMPSSTNANESSGNTKIEASVQSALNNLSSINDYPISEVTLKSSGSVYVRVRQKLDNKILLAKSLIDGEIQTIKRRGPVDIAFTKGDLISLLTNDELTPVKPNTKSAGTITLP